MWFRYKFRIGVVFGDQQIGMSEATRYYRLEPNPRVVAPSLPPRVRATKSLSKDAIELRWDYPLEEKAHLDGFILTYRIVYPEGRFGRLINVRTKTYLVIVVPDDRVFDVSICSGYGRGKCDARARFGLVASGHSLPDLDGRL